MKLILTITIIFFTSNIFAQENWLIDLNGCKVLNPSPKKNESVEWTGNCIDSIAEGQGQLIWYLRGKKTEFIYTGLMKNGRPEGEGKYILSKSRTIEGNFSNGQITFGKETQAWKKDSIIYIGEFENEMANGKGTMYFSYQEWFKGEFQDDYFKDGIFTSKLYGYVIESDDWKYYLPNSGKVIWDDGRIYEGQLKNLSPNGKGTMKYPNGQIEKGIWKKGYLKEYINNGM